MLSKLHWITASSHGHQKPCNFQNTNASSTADKADIVVNKMSHGLSLCSTACAVASALSLCAPEDKICRKFLLLHSQQL